MSPLPEPARRSTGSTDLASLGEDVRDVLEYLRSQPVMRAVTYKTDDNVPQVVQLPDGMRRVLGATFIKCIDSVGELFALSGVTRPVEGGVELTADIPGIATAALPVTVTAVIYGEA